MIRWAVIVGALIFLMPCVVHAQGQLEVPSGGSFVSGLGYISGWKCTAGTLTFTIDGGSLGHLVYGGERSDTSSTCGDATNGFIVQYNWNLLLSGQHTIRVYDNGLLFAQAAFTTTKPTPQEFLTGQSSSTSASLAGKTVTLAWQEDQQNFVIVGVSGGGGSQSSNFTGVWAIQQCLQSRSFCDNDAAWKIVQNATFINIVTLFPNISGCSPLDFISFSDLQVTGSTLTGTVSTDTTDLICGSYGIEDFTVTLGADGNSFSGTGSEFLNPECDLSTTLNYRISGTRVSECTS